MGRQFSQSAFIFFQLRLIFPKTKKAFTWFCKRNLTIDTTWASINVIKVKVFGTESGGKA